MIQMWRVIYANGYLGRDFFNRYESWVYRVVAIDGFSVTKNFCNHWWWCPIRKYRIFSLIGPCHIYGCGFQKVLEPCGNILIYFIFVFHFYLLIRNVPDCGTSVFSYYGTVTQRIYVASYYFRLVAAWYISGQMMLSLSILLSKSHDFIGRDNAPISLYPDFFSSDFKVLPLLLWWEITRAFGFTQYRDSLSSSFFATVLDCKLSLLWLSGLYQFVWKRWR